MNIEVLGNYCFEEHFSTVSDGHVCRTQDGFDFMQLRYIVGGECKVRGDTAEYRGGDLLFIPSNVPYELTWVGNNVEFYTLEFTADCFNCTANKILKVEKADVQADFVALLNEQSKLKALSIFYSLLAKVERQFDKENTAVMTVAPAIEYIEANYLLPMTVTQLAKLCCLSSSRFYTVFKNETGKSPIDYKNELKIKKAVFMLQDGFSVEKTAAALNFCSTAFFRRIFKNVVGITPMQCKKNGKSAK